MEEILEQKIVEAVRQWAADTYSDQEIVIGQVTLDGDEELGDDDTIPEENDADRYLVDFAVRSVGQWLVAEVWVNGRSVLGLNDLGEGLPLEDIDWPWQ
jgi:hypothetical protein